MTARKSTCHARKIQAHDRTCLFKATTEGWQPKFPPVAEPAINILINQCQPSTQKFSLSRDRKIFLTFHLSFQHLAILWRLPWIVLQQYAELPPCQEMVTDKGSSLTWWSDAELHKACCKAAAQPAGVVICGFFLTHWYCHHTAAEEQTTGKLLGCWGREILLGH